MPALFQKAIDIYGRSQKKGGRGGGWETIPWRQKRILDAQNIVYDGRSAYQTTLEHVLVIFGDFENFWIF